MNRVGKYLCAGFASALAIYACTPKSDDANPSEHGGASNAGGSGVAGHAIGDGADGGVGGTGDAQSEGGTAGATVEAGGSAGSPLDGQAGSSAAGTSGADNLGESGASNQADCGALGQSCCGASCSSGLACLAKSSCSCLRDVFGAYVVRADGKLLYEGSSEIPILNAETGLPLENVRDVQDAFYHGCASVTDGSVWCWRTHAQYGNSVGHLAAASTDSNGPLWRATKVLKSLGAPLSDVVSLATGSVAVGCAITGAGELYCWGDLSWIKNGGTALTSAYAVPITSGRHGRPSLVSCKRHLQTGQPGTTPGLSHAQC